MTSSPGPHGLTSTSSVHHDSRSGFSSQNQCCGVVREVPRYRPGWRRPGETFGAETGTQLVFTGLARFPALPAGTQGTVGEAGQVQFRQVEPREGASLLLSPVPPALRACSVAATSWARSGWRPRSAGPRVTWLGGPGASTVPASRADRSSSTGRMDRPRNDNSWPISTGPEW